MRGPSGGPGGPPAEVGPVEVEVEVGLGGAAFGVEDGWFGEVDRPPEVLVGELSAQEVDDFFGAG